MADDSEHMMQRGKKAFNAAKEKMSAILNEVNNVRQSLRDLKEDAENFHEKCNVARTTKEYIKTIQTCDSVCLVRLNERAGRFKRCNSTDEPIASCSDRNGTLREARRWVNSPIKSSHSNLLVSLV